MKNLFKNKKILIGLISCIVIFLITTITLLILNRDLEVIARNIGFNSELLENFEFNDNEDIEEEELYTAYEYSTYDEIVEVVSNIVNNNTSNNVNIGTTTQATNNRPTVTNNAAQPQTQQPTTPIVNSPPTQSNPPIQEAPVQVTPPVEQPQAFTGWRTNNAEAERMANAIRNHVAGRSQYVVVNSGAISSHAHQNFFAPHMFFGTIDNMNVPGVTWQVYARDRVVNGVIEFTEYRIRPI